METIIVTRHAALVQYIINSGLAPSHGTKVLSHATAEDVEGKHVIGVLPLHLAALAAKVTVVTIDIPLEKRGVELSLEDLNEMVVETVSYKVIALNQDYISALGAD